MSANSIQEVQICVKYAALCHGVLEGDGGEWGKTERLVHYYGNCNTQKLSPAKCQVHNRCKVSLYGSQTTKILSVKICF